MQCGIHAIMMSCIKQGCGNYGRRVIIDYNYNYFIEDAQLRFQLPITPLSDNYNKKGQQLHTIIGYVIT